MAYDKINAEIIPEGFEIHPNFQNLDPEMKVAVMSGIKGDPGEKGDTGESATITVGSTTTGQPGTNASVTNSGTSSAAVLNFTIPRGAKGDTGEQGEQGERGVGIADITFNDDYTLTITDDDGTEYTTESIRGAQGEQGEKGDTGDTGSQGEQGIPGTAATIAVGNVSSGSTASVTNSGTSSAAVFNFVLPKGDKGDTGSKGDPGNKGETGDTGNGIDYVTLNSDYTLTITFTDGTSTTTSSIRGAQGDTGDKGDTGTGISSVTKTGTSGLVDTYTITFTDNTTTTFTVTNGKDGTGSVISVNGQTGDVVLDADDVGALPDDTAIPTKTSDLTNDSGYITSSALPTKVSDLTNDSGFITSSSLPTKVSDLTNDAGYITGYTETDPTVPSWAKASSKPSYTASEVGAMPSNATFSFTGSSGSVSVTGTPSGSVSAPTISVGTAGSTSNAATAVTAAAPGATAPSNAVTYYSYDSATSTLKLYQIGYNTSAFKTGDASYTASTPTFTGSSTTSTGTFTPSGSVTKD